MSLVRSRFRPEEFVCASIARGPVIPHKMYVCGLRVVTFGRMVTTPIEGGGRTGWKSESVNYTCIIV